jgi:hypothetical protein
MALNVRVNGGLGRNWRKDIVVQLWHYLPGITGHRSERKIGYLISWKTIKAGSSLIYVRRNTATLNCLLKQYKGYTVFPSKESMLIYYFGLKG